MKKKIGVLLLGFIAVLGLVGCEEQEIIYQDKLRPVSQVEEIISDQLEIENPELDLEVNISQEVED